MSFNSSLEPGDLLRDGYMSHGPSHTKTCGCRCMAIQLVHDMM